MSQQLGRYTLLGKLATGGMAEVFLARLDGTSGFERHVVIKRVLPQYASQPEFLQLFEQEARFASYLSHPHIATVSDFGVNSAGLAYLVMEHVDGASLRKLLRAAKLRDEQTDARLISRVFSQVAEALAAVHAAVEPSTGRPLELLHRDVSPENILLSRQGAVKLADFGIARAMNEVGTTRPDVVRGKLAYLAPEQVLGEPMSPTVDVWALGISLYEALALRRPFGGENEGHTLRVIVEGQYAPIESVRGDIPPELRAVIARCLAREPRKRYPDCQDLALELERIASAGAYSITTRVIGNWVERLAPPEVLKPLEPESPALQTADLRLAPAALAPLEPPVPTDEDAPSDRPRWRWSLVLAGLGLVALVTMMVLGWRHRSGVIELRPVLVTSTPSGATLKHGQTVLGTTPWAGDLPAQQVVLELTAPGFRSVQQTLAPGETTIQVVLKRSGK